MKKENRELKVKKIVAMKVFAICESYWLMDS